MEKPSYYRNNQRQKYKEPGAVKEKWIKIFKNINLYTDPNTMLQSVKEAFTLVECVMGNTLQSYREQYISYGTPIEGERDAYVFHYDSGDIMIDFMDSSVFGMTKYLRQIGYNLPDEIDETRKLRNFIAHNLETTTNEYFKDNMNYNTVLQAIQNLGQSLVVLGMLQVHEIRPSFDEMRVQVGDVLGLSNEFTVDRFIAKSGTSRLYEGTHTRLNRKVAIKELLPDTFSETLLFNERDLLVGLKHARIPSIYDVFNQNGTFYIIMDYIEGVGLDKYLIINECSLEEKLRIIYEICDVVNYLHASKGMIHADLKPQNVMIDENGRAFIIDFGTSLTKNTQVKVRGVSAGYTAPEVIEGKKFDYRIDIYSIGAIIKYAFKTELSDNEEKKDDNIERIAQIVNRCMEQNPYARYNNVVEIQAEINTISQYKSVSQQMMVKPKKRVNVPRIILYTVCIAVIALSLTIKIKNYMDSKKDDSSKTTETSQDISPDDDSNTNNSSGNQVYEFTDEEVLEQFKILEQKAWECFVDNDEDGYVALFRSDANSEAALRQSFKLYQAQMQDIYDDLDYIVLYNENGICYGCATRSLVSGDENNATYVRREFTYSFSYKDNEWCLDVTPETIAVTNKKAGEKICNALSENYNAAREEGRNYALFCGENYIWLDNTLVYEGMLEGSVIAASQLVDGSVEVVVSIKNGTGQKKMVNTCEISIYMDEGLEIVNNYAAEINIEVAAGTSELVSFIVPKESVSNIAAVWNNMKSELIIK